MYELEYKETCLFQIKNLLYETDVQLNKNNYTKFRIGLFNTYHPLHGILFKYVSTE